MERHSEQELDQEFHRLATGDRSAFSSVFRTLQPIVERFCLRILDHHADAQDAAQRTLEKLFFRAADYDSSRSAVGYALGIALWECKTIKRQNLRRRSTPLEHEPVGAATSPEGELERRDLERALAAALEQLPELDRRTLAEWLLTESTQDPTFRKRKQRALERLRHLWRNLRDT